MLRYAPSSYDEYFCLRSPLLLWIAVLYFSRAIVLPLIMGLGRFVGIDRDAAQMLWGLWSVQALLPSLIAAVLLYPMFRRVPSASRLVRWIWAHGRLLLTLAAAIDLALLAISLSRMDYVDDQALPQLIAAALDAYFVSYILIARRVRDTFADFPALMRPD